MVVLLISRGKGKQLRKPSNLATFGITLVVLGVLFDDAGRWLSYSLMGVGVSLTVRIFHFEPRRVGKTFAKDIHFFSY